MLLPALAKAREFAKRSSCLGNLKQIGTAMIMYAESFQRYPRIDTGAADYPDLVDRDSIGALDAEGISPPQSTSKLWDCPSSSLPPDDDVVAAGKYALFDLNPAGVGTPNYMVTTNWRGTPFYVSTTALSPGSVPLSETASTTGPGSKTRRAGAAQ